MSAPLSPTARRIAIALAVLVALAAVLLSLRVPIQEALRGTALDAPLRMLKRRASEITRTPVRCGNRELEPGTPSLVMITVDTLRADHLGFLGRRDRNVSPRLDELAEDAWIFENAIAPAPWTTPSFASVVTGRAPAALGIEEQPVPIPREAKTLGERLCEAGFRTAGVVSHTYVGQRYGFDRGFEHWDETHAGGHTHVSSLAVTAAAIEELEEFAKQAEPFFLFTHYFDPHYDFREHASFPFSKGPAPPIHSEADNIHELRKLAREDRLPPRTLRHLHDSYDSEIAFTDAAIGKLLRRLKQLGLYENTLIVFLADHGELFAERDDRWIGHTRSVHQAAIHVPLLVKLPGANRHAKRHNRRISYTVSTSDVAATVIDALGLGGGGSRSSESAVPGISLLGSRKAQRPVFSQTRQEASRDAIIDGRLKLIVDRKTDRRELYDLKDDPAERKNLAARAPQLARQLEKQLDRWIAESRQTARGFSREEAPPLGAEERRRLEALGYLTPDPEREP